MHRAVSSYGRADHEEVPDLARTIPSGTFYALPHPLQLSGFTILGTAAFFARIEPVPL